MKTCPKCKNETSDELFHKLKKCFFCGDPTFSGFTYSNRDSRLDLISLANITIISILVVQSIMAFRRSIPEGIASIVPLFLLVLVYYYLLGKRRIEEEN